MCIVFNPLKDVNLSCAEIVVFVVQPRIHNVILDRSSKSLDAGTNSIVQKSMVHKVIPGCGLGIHWLGVGFEYSRM